MLVTAKARNLRVSPDKVRLVIGQIKKMPPQEAVKILDFVPKKSSKMIKKAVLSAIANAKNNFGLNETSLSFKEITVGKGIVFKRFRPVARGRAHSILRRTSNLTVILEGQEPKKAEKPVTTENTEKVATTEVTEKKTKNTERSDRGTKS